MKGQSLRLLLPLSILIVLTGCASDPITPASTSALAHTLRGGIRGGQQPVTGATIQLYTVGTTGDASAAQPLLTKAVLTDASGSFSITGDYNCNNATQVYLTATGGNPGLSAPNPNLVMMAALGPCSALTASTFVWVNELTTAAAAYALANYATSATNIGSGTSDAPLLATAFTLANEYVNTSNGQAPGVNIPAGFTDPTATLNTLADILSVCINSNGGVANDKTPCGTLFALTPSAAGTAPADTFTAILNLAKYPGLNTAAIFNLLPAQAPFQPALAQPPTDFNLRITQTGGGSYVDFSPTAPIAFGDESVNGPLEYAPVDLQLAHLGDVTMEAFNIIGPNASDFSTVLYSCLPGTVLGSDVNRVGCHVDIAAKPSALGTRVAYLQIVSTAPDSPYYIKLYFSGTAVATTPTKLYLSAGPMVETYDASATGSHNLISSGGDGSTVGALRFDYVGNLFEFGQVSSVGQVEIANFISQPGLVGQSPFNPTPPAGYSFNGGGNTLSAASHFAVDNQQQIYIPVQTATTPPQLGIAVYPPNSIGNTAPSFVVPNYGGQVAVDAIGNLYALDSLGNINIFLPGLQPTSSPLGGDALADQLGTGPDARVLDMATDGNGLIYALIFGNNGYEVVAYSNTYFTRSALKKAYYGAICQINHPTAIAADGAGNLYVSDTSATTHLPVVLVFSGIGGENYLTPPSTIIQTDAAVTGAGIAVR